MTVSAVSITICVHAWEQKAESSGRRDGPSAREALAAISSTRARVARKRAAGVALDRYSATPGARRVSTVHALTGLALVLSAAVLEWGFDVIGALAVAGMLLGVLTVVMGHRVDEAVRRDLRAGHDQTAV